CSSDLAWSPTTSSPSTPTGSRKPSTTPARSSASSVWWTPCAGTATARPSPSSRRSWTRSAPSAPTSSTTTSRSSWPGAEAPPGLSASRRATPEGPATAGPSRGRTGTRRFPRGPRWTSTGSTYGAPRPLPSVGGRGPLGRRLPAPAQEGQQHRYALPVPLVGASVFIHQVALLELDGHQDVGGGCDGEHQVGDGHGRGGPEREEPADVQGMPDQPV